MDALTIACVVGILGTAALLRWRRPAWYWLTFGALVAVVRLRVRYASVMDACGLTVPPSRLRLLLAGRRGARCRPPGPRVSAR